MKNEPDCKTGLGQSIISAEVFERELGMCKKLNRENGGGCCWGRCDDCGVIPLLHKLGKGVLYEKKEDVEELKKNSFGY